MYRVCIITKGERMKTHIYRCLSLSILLTGLSLQADPETPVANKFVIRSQGANALRRIIQSTDKDIRYDAQDMYGNYSLTTEYTRSLNPSHIARSLFGDSLCGGRYLAIQGSRVPNRNENALLADYFYLPTDFNSQVEVRPEIQNFVADINLRFGLDNWATGLYAWIQMPVTWTKWNLHLQEQIINPGANAHDEGYFSVNALPRSALLANFTNYAQGVAPFDPTNGMVNGVLTETASKAGTTQTFVNRFDPLSCGNMCPNAQSNTRISEIRGALGWDFLLEDRYHLGVNIQVSIPTGTKSDSGELFGPQNGNDHHAELGGAITGHYTFWKSQDEESMWSINLDANLTHLFGKNQVRCFDVCGKPLSRYMLVEKLGTPVTDGLVGSTQTPQPIENPTNPTAPTSQFKAEFAPLANVTSFNVDVSVGVQADVVLWLNYSKGPWSWDLGYNLYARSCEKIDLDCDCQETKFAENTWAFKGDAWVYGYMRDNDATVNPTLFQDNPIALSATMSEATINEGKNLGAGGTTATDFSSPTSNLSVAHQNPNIDNPQFAYAGNTNSIPLDINRTFARAINTSIQPVFIKQEDINFTRMKTISNKIFSHLGYTCKEGEHYTPYWGVGFEVEWATGNGDNCNDCDESCDTECSTACNTDCETGCDNSTNGTCVKSGLSQWGVWARFGVTFQ